MFLHNCTNRLLNMYTQMFPGVEQLCRSHSSPLNTHNILADLLKLEPTYFIFFSFVAATCKSFCACALLIFSWLFASFRCLIVLQKCIKPQFVTRFYTTDIPKRTFFMGFFNCLKADCKHFSLTTGRTIKLK